MIGSVREYFLLSNASAAAKLLPETVRSTLHRRLSLARQRAEGADALWSNGHVAEGLRLAAEAFEASIEAIEPFADTSAAPAPIAKPAIEAKAAPEADEPEPEAESKSEAESEAEPEAKSDAESEAEPEAKPEVESEAEPEAKSEAEPEAESDAASASEPPAKRTSEAPPAASVAQSKRAEEEAIAAAQDSKPHDPAWAAALRRRGLSDARVREIVSAERSLRARQLPLLDAEVSAAEGELFQQLVGGRRHIERVLGPVAMAPRQLLFTRVSRIGFAVLLSTVAIAGTWFLTRPVHGVEARASGQFNPEFVPGRIIDGDLDSEWLMPQQQPTGWIEVAILPPQDIETVRVRNSHNRAFNDRATKDYTIEIFSGGRLARSIQGSWPTVDPTPDWTAHAVGVEDVERIRFNVRSIHRNGGGLAEMEWE
jgi:hypothetical protein